MNAVRKIEEIFNLNKFKLSSLLLKYFVNVYNIYMYVYQLLSL